MGYCAFVSILLLFGYVGYTKWLTIINIIFFTYKYSLIEHDVLASLFYTTFTLLIYYFSAKYINSYILNTKQQH